MDFTQTSQASTPVSSSSPSAVVELDRTGRIAYLIDIFEYGTKDRIRIIDPSNGSERALAANCYVCDSISWASDENFIVYSGTVQPPIDHSEIFRVNVVTGAIQQVTKSVEGKYGVALSPDAKHAVIDVADPQTGEPDLAILEMSTGRLQKLASTPGPDYNPAWSPDGQHIAYAYSEDYRQGWHIWMVNADGGSAQQVSTLAVGDQISWAPNSKMLAVSSPLECGSIYVLDVNSHEVRRLTHLSGCASNPVWSPSGQTIAFVNKIYADPAKRSVVKEWVIYLMSADGKGMLSVKSGVGERDPVPTFLAWSRN